MSDIGSIFSIFEKIASVPAVCGFARARAEVVADLVRGLADEIAFDALGSLVARRGDAKNIRVAVFVRLDDAGFMVKYVEQDGRIRLMPLGALDPGAIVGARVRFENGLCGVLLSGLPADEAKKPTMADLFVDTGLSSHGVEVGSTASFASETLLQGDVAMGPSVGSVATCAAAIRFLQTTCNSDAGVAVVFASQSEVGQRGAKAASFSLKAEYGVAIDISDASSALKTGAGPVLKWKDRSAVYCRDVLQRLEDAAHAEAVGLQHEILDRADTETAGGHLLAAGIPAAALGIPVRYRLTANEIANLSDAEQTARTLAAFAGGYMK
ncbi:hypothetical protein LJC31_02195 [Synergistaceae bacterium OttesenSCG-928-I11]|nr:hypothetical protein [Synergistaceae bacterium OttesenSCG-928-I11]